MEAKINNLEERIFLLNEKRIVATMENPSLKKFGFDNDVGTK